MLEQHARFNAKGMNIFLLASVPIQPKRARTSLPSPLSYVSAPPTA
ncbi:hypothetical protein TC41_2662 [Alicyclobacillus acidocaldarius subsp. acidocaldarius Tc-4-1]|uniref:Uncharacterized protein n=1 Tax=Alicyclobacillus acidocaldarius (strain Tc-4-1) TaxID=1048834 RepID=F8II77_ALIAT|nr:hypothetical protein TC41_2662 [Alicyclobacillus acidocaldarius subsp. acidocaldarius Tc-4-1]